MYREIRKLILSSFLFIILSCKTNNKITNKEYLDFVFLRGMEMPKEDGYQYSENCFLYYSKYKFLIEESYNYKKGILKEYIYCGPEGADIRDYNKEKYSKDKQIFSKQKLFVNKEEIKFNEINYSLKSKIKDTIIAFNDDETIMIILSPSSSQKK